MIKRFLTAAIILLYCTNAHAQFNGTSGIYALNHVLWGVMASPFSVATPGSGYATNDTVTLDCPNTSTFLGPNTVHPVVTWNGSAWVLNNPGVATSIPSTGLAGGLNGVCTLTQLSTSGTGSGVTFNATFGPNAASLNGSNTTGGGGGGTTPGGANGSIQYNNSGSFGGLANPLPIGNGGTGSASPSGVIAGTNITISGSFPNQTVNATGGGGGSLSITDGTHTVSPTTALTINGATVGGSTPNASITISGGGTITGFATHAALISATTAFSTNTLTQAGFYAAGDGGQATYQWNTTTYGFCNGGTMGSPVAADGIACILPSGQSSSTAGRYILQLSDGIDVRQIGMVGDGITDNSSIVPTLMSLMNTGSQASQSDVHFPKVPGQEYTNYYFSAPFHVTRPMMIRCEGWMGADSGTRLVFPAGVHGVIFDNFSTSPDGTGLPGGGMQGCGIVNSGFYEGYPVTTGSNAVISIGADKYFGTWGFHVGDGIITYLYGPTNGQPAIAPGATITATNPGVSITPSSPLISGYTGAAFGLWRLPVEDAFTVNTSSGSPDVTVTAGPSVLQPGDFIWSDAFPFGTTILTTSNTGGGPVAQTVTMAPYSLNNSATTNATKSETGGHMWIIPAAIKTFTGFSLKRNWLGTFGIGLEMECSFWSSAHSGCNASLAEENIFVFDIFGRMVMGDNAGASTSFSNIYSYNSFADIVEGGAVGSTYYNENANSQEASTALYSIVGECVNSNSSSFFGGYAPTTGGYCLNDRLDTAPTSGGVVAFIFPQTTTPTGAPVIYNNNFANNWFFAGPSYGMSVCMNKPGDVLAWSRDNQGCGGPETWTIGWDTRGFWVWDYFTGAGGNTMLMTEGALGGYTGYTAGNLALMSFQQGLLLYDAEAGGGGIGSERLLDEGVSIPAATFHQFGDIHFNQNAFPGTNFAWIDTYNGQTNLGSAVTGGVTTSVSIGGCPAYSLPAGTPVMDNSNPAIPLLIGTVSTCVSTTLTFQSTATASAASGHQIMFMLWKPVGIVQDSAPTISSCGTGSPSVAAGSTNIFGSFTMGTGSPTACTITFAHAYPTTAFCTVTPASPGGAAITGGDYLSAISASGFTWTLGTGTSSLVFDYTCGGN
jgi:hypothetical protein